ncbi:group II intron maturase-specific domain-containing protein [Sphaerimonospora cavernae]|uniref:Group II intron maturase-specific domain-containing protein n=1 Tax=Sphaerimonospora cavernae TaxID=1740611 RepID=A0ABV6U3B7_9ACTN
MIRSWRIHLHTTTDLAELAQWINPVVRGWMNYYGRFYRTELDALIRRINTYLVRWGRRKFKRLRSFKKAKRCWNVSPPCSLTGPWMTEF